MLNNVLCIVLALLWWNIVLVGFYGVWY